MDNDMLDFIIKAAHLAGTLEAQRTIEVHDWEPLNKEITDYIDWYFNSSNGADFFDALEDRLIKAFPPE